MRSDSTHLAQEPCDDVANHDGLVGLVVVPGRGDTSEVPQIGLPFVQPDRRIISQISHILPRPFLIDTMTHRL